MGVAGLDELREVRDTYAAGLSVEFVDFPADQWEERGGRIVHRRTNFFEIAGHREDSGRERVMFRQPESALVGLLTAKVDGVRFFALNVRAEPGLHGRCQFSTTIQSTPSNYERRHGGAATPLIDLFLERPRSVRVIKDSWQYDWAEYYDAKVKRFVVLECDGLLPIELPLMWVTDDDLKTLLEEDYAVTADLRAAVLLREHRGAAGGRVVVAQAGNDWPGEVPLRELRNWRVEPHGIDEIEPDVGLSIRYVRVRSGAREVREWSQPLMQVARPLVVTLAIRVASDGRGLLAAVELRTAAGLRGRRLWFPAGVVDGSPVPRRPALNASAEGGRFLQHGIRVEVVTAVDSAVDAGAEWMELERLRDLANTDLATSLELRLALSRVADLADGGPS